jgi:hypothetical protein
MSFFSKDLYRDVSANWKGYSFAYLFSLLAICLIPGVLSIHAELSSFLSEQAPKIISQMPTITISKGLASVDRPQPYVIKDEKTGSPVIILDTTGQITTLKETKASVLLTRNAIIFRSDGEERTLDLTGLDDMTINRVKLYEMIDSLDSWFAVLLYPIALLFSFAYHVLQVLVYAGVGLMYAKSLKAPLEYANLIRLSTVAITPAVLIGAMLVLGGLSIPAWWVFSFLFSLGYLFFGVKVNAGPQLKNTPTTQ